MRHILKVVKNELNIKRYDHKIVTCINKQAEAIARGDVMKTRKLKKKLEKKLQVKYSIFLKRRYKLMA